MKILEKMHERIVKGFLDIAIMAKLMEENPISGHDVVTFFYRKFGIRLSPGTVYNTLYSMERNELVKGMWKRRKRVYRLTEKGEKTIKSVLNMVEETQSFIKVLFSG